MKLITFKSKDLNFVLSLDIKPLKKTINHYSNILQTLLPNFISDDNKYKMVELLTSLCYLHYDSNLIRNPYNVRLDLKADPNFIVLLSDEVIIHDADLNAVLHDLNWLLTGNYKSAKVAIEYYFKSFNNNFDEENWTYCFDKIDRAIRLSKLINSQDEVKKLLRNIKAKIIKLNGNDKLWLSFRLIELYISFSKSVSSDMIRLIRLNAKNAYKQFDYKKSNDFWLLLITSGNKNNNIDLNNEGFIRSARTLRNQAKFRRSHDKNSQVAASFMHEAIKSLLKVKGFLKLKDRWYFKLRQYQEEATSQFAVIETPIDYSKSIANIRNALNVSDFESALKVFISIYKPRKISESKKFVREKIKNHPLSSMFSKIMYDHRSKITSTNNGFSFKDNLSDEEIHSEVIQDYNFFQSHYGASIYGYTFNELVKNFNADINVIHRGITETGFIAPNQINLATNLLYNAFNGNLETFLYTSIPLFENGLRNLLYTTGASVFAIKSKIGEQNEWTFDYILEQISNKKLLPEDIIIDIDSLLVNEHGTKLRHNLAHGLLPENVHYTGNSLYFLFMFSYFSLLSLILPPKTPPNESVE